MQFAQTFHAPTITSEKILKLTFLVLILRLTHKIFRKLKKTETDFSVSKNVVSA